MKLSKPSANPWRYRIRGNAGNEVPRNYVFCYADSELIEQVNEAGAKRKVYQFTLGHAVYLRRENNQWRARKEITFHKQIEFWLWVRQRCQPRQPTWVFSHNWHFQSQLLQFWQELDAGRFQLGLPKREWVDDDGELRHTEAWQGMLAIDHGVFAVYAVCPFGTVKLVDVTNYFGIPLADLAKSTGLPLEPETPEGIGCAASRQRIISAVEIIQTVMTRTIDNWQADKRGNWQPTAARLAWSNWRHEYHHDHEVEREREVLRACGREPEPVNTFYINVIDDRLDREFQRRAFFGGRASNWFRGQYHGKAYKVDISGAYAAVMQTGLFPTCLLNCAASHDGNQIGPPSLPMDSIGEVECFACGDLPVRSASGNVEYPQGLCRTTLAGPELDVLQRSSRIRQWFRWEQYRCEPIFQQYVTYWWSIREQARELGNEANVLLAKMMLNCLFGVFAKKTPVWKMTSQGKPNSNWGYFYQWVQERKAFVRFRSVAGACQIEQGSEERNDTFPAVSAFVTSYQRVKMNEVRHSLPEKSCILQQTDSLVLTEQGSNEIRHSGYWGPGQLGRFRDVCTIDNLYVWSANHYTGDGFECLAGLDRHAKKESDNLWRVERKQNAVDVIGGGVSDVVRVKETTFQNRMVKNEREYDRDGWAYM